jgi:hypothetical protein
MFKVTEKDMAEWEGFITVHINLDFVNAADMKCLSLMICD